MLEISGGAEALAESLTKRFGATTTSHVNDSGFWLVNRYLGLSVFDTLKPGRR